MLLVPVTPPEPIISAADAKIRAPALANLDDALVDALIAAGTALAQEMLERAIGIQEWDISFDAPLTCYPHGILPAPYWYAYGQWHGPAIELPLPPLVSVESIAYVDADDAAQIWDEENYRVSGIGGTGRITLATGGAWPVLGPFPEAMTVRFIAGYETPPEPIIQGVLLMATSMQTAGGNTAGVRRESVPGVWDITYGDAAASGSYATTAAKAMLWPYKVFQR